MGVLITRHRTGFAAGLTAVTTLDERDTPMGIALEVLKLRAGEEHAERLAGEAAWLLMAGRITMTINNQRESFARASLFDEAPSCVHAAAGCEIRVRAETDAELTIYRCANTKGFEARIYRPADVPDEQRGKGQVGGMCLRLVRTIFDNARSDKNAELVLGEVVTLPGRWSSYPPHHHSQPEIYHYRFDRPEGFGHAEHGEEVYKVRAHDTLKILGGNDHAQCAAPGYAMYYSWVIRNLPGNPYGVPEFTAEHRWTMEPGARVWHPRDG
jgi:5-deoxy-glucuronate isomerase